jgi:hypothetical protein
MHRYKYTILLLATFLTAWAVGRLGYLDALAASASESNQILFAFIAGALYSFSFTAAFAVILFANMAIVHDAVWPLAIIAATGGLATDITLLRFIKGVLSEELTGHAKKIVDRAMNNRLVRFCVQLLGGIIIASPLPEEIGLTFLGISHLSFWRTVCVTYVLDIIGAYAVIMLVSNVL